MDLWSNLCRCCLAEECEVSLLDGELKVKEKFQEITSVQVRLNLHKIIFILENIT